MMANGAKSFRDLAYSSWLEHSTRLQPLSESGLVAGSPRAARNSANALSRFCNWLNARGFMVRHELGNPEKRRTPAPFEHRKLRLAATSGSFVATFAH